MGLTFTPQEKLRQHELRVQIEAAPTEAERDRLREELDSIRVEAHARMFQRAEAKTKAEEGEAVEVVKPEDMLSPDELTESQEDRARIQELRKEIAAATRRKKTVDLQDELDDLIDCEGELGRRVERRAIKSGKCLPTPMREDCYDDDDFEETMAWHRLNLLEAACYRKLNSAKTSFNLHKTVEKELQVIEKKRRELRPENYESESLASTSKAPDLDDGQPITPKPAPSPADMSDVALRESFSKQRDFRDQMSFTDRDQIIAALETEILRRQLPMYWSVKGEKCVYVDSSGSSLTNIANRVYMGERDSNEENVPVPTSE
jgi:hypothetical protein